MVQKLEMSVADEVRIAVIRRALASAPPAHDGVWADNLLRELWRLEMRQPGRV